MNKKQQFKGTSSKKFLTALAIAFFFSTAGSVQAIAGTWTANTVSGVSEQQQSISVKGVVTDSKGEPVIGASILEKGTSNNGAITDINGNFSLKVKPNATLVVSYIGFKKQEVAVGGKVTVNIVLKENSEILDEVVVVGYGTQKKENLTGAVSTVDVAKVFGSKPIIDMQKGLQGMVPGLTITFNSGELNTTPDIKIRGLGSLNGVGSPLLLLDGVEISDLSLVNPSDIAIFRY